jgi:hypothetical protein
MKQGTIVVCTYGFNKVLKKPFEFLYEYGYKTRDGCVVYIKGEKNMQDSHAFKLNQVRIATEKDFQNLFYGN